MRVVSSDTSSDGSPAPEGVPLQFLEPAGNCGPCKGLLGGAPLPCRSADPGGRGVDAARTLRVAPGHGHCSPHGFCDLSWQEATKLPKSTPEERDR